MQENILSQYIKNRLRHNKNFLAVICGGTGSGKSYAAIKLAEESDKTFSMDKVCFDARTFMNAVNRCKAGSVIIFDEAGVGMPSREWQTLSNKLLGYVLQTFRHKNLVVFFTTPDFSMIDVQARKLFHCYLETCGINHQRKICYLKPLFIQNNSRYGKLYYKYLRTNTTGKMTVVKKFGLTLANKELLDQYEIRKCKFTEWLNHGVMSSIKDRFVESTKKYVCLKCGYEWDAKSDNPYKLCPRKACRSSNTARKEDVSSTELFKVVQPVYTSN